jgi:DNA (cytosine-5)-methyltransferase 1
VDIAEELPTVISFCSGYGGIERGLDLAGVKHRVIAYVEIEAFAIANLVAKMESGQLVPAPIFTDLKTFPAHLFRDCVDIITGGYPCQPFSAAGKRLGTEDPRHLWPYILDHIRSIRPVRCMFENVEGHISLGLREVIGDLEGAGYDAAWGIFSASEVGAPHQRKRVYIVADSHNGQRELKNEEIRTGRDASVYGSEELADTGIAGLPQRDRQGASTKGQPYAESQCGGGLPPDMADSAGKFSERRIAEGVASWKPEEAIGDRGAFASVADTVSEGSQGRLSGREDTERESQRGHLGRGGTALQRGQEQSWPPEPGLGRVVDGCADRVDRIRLLGNGVVPQTAAKAWTTLTSRGKK